MTSTMDLVDKQILNIIQTRFPLAERPFEVIASEMGSTEDDVINRLKGLKAKNVVRQISAIFDTRRLGYKTTLVAMRLPPDTLDSGAQVVNRHPGVSHNYARDGHFNLWFTLAVPPYEDLKETIDRMAEETGAESVRIMPTIKFFKIGVNFDMVKGEGDAKEYFSPDGFDKTNNEDWNKAEEVSDFDIKVIRELQEDIDLVPQPFTPMAERLGISLQELFDAADDFQKRGMMRRFSAVLHHRKAGFSSNAMAVWKVPSERSVEVGNLMAQSRWVTHCYERPTFPGWDYTHFTMIHATSQDQCEEVAREISETTGISEYQLLYSTREYKKTRVRYFV
ncbi:MAG: Lrp/AsnC family transcriptional regulator [Chloroflexi bacterium]|nr:Lrp/AsnC family transcriptional regulator [Chloroflexota bacterium]MCI0813394.1 Lrp/AsnC family transcriptional regulator [Chloroflexota bacterium]MCI0822283.1 Lrp/AsnC family transcriptional regulator [Chloroflexota bacterium]MCI0870085.1 Lrp/AsnC family transcriptional regulator [Chloroflexota bacterium]MCI0887860.1 Lrp/AsnC family transcriptional regulator [Chloroflexota bacterium]